MSLPLLGSRMAGGPLLSLAAAPVIVTLVYLYRYHALISICSSFLGGLSVAYFARRWRRAHFMPQLPSQTYVAAAEGSPRAGGVDIPRPTCLTCGRNDCQRHKHVTHVLSQLPWSDVFVPERVDRAIESFFGLVLQKFVYSWYRDVSEDEAFVIEARKAIRFAVAVLIKRLQMVNVPYLLEKKVIPEIIKHAVITTHYLRRDTSSLTSEELAQRCFKEDMHCALTSRVHAADYLHAVFDKVLPHILSSEMLQCVSLTHLVKGILSEGIMLSIVDIVSDADTINKLLLVLLDMEPPAEDTKGPSRSVIVLERFVGHHYNNDAAVAEPGVNCIENSLHSILGDQMLLVKFMDYMKSKGATSYLQLCLSASAFRKEFIKMPCQYKDLSNLHADITDLYCCYMKADSFDRIDLDSQVVDSFKRASDGRPDELYTFCTTKMVDRLCEVSRQLLEHMFLPDFLASFQHFSYLYGPRDPQRRDRGPTWKQPAGQKKRKNIASLSLTGEKQVKDQDLQMLTAASTAAAAAVVVVPLPPPPLPTTELAATGQRRSSADRLLSEELHDLKEWHVTIPSISVLPEKELFQVQVLRQHDIPAVSVYRSLGDFHKLEQKLKEFHGSATPDLQLPPRRTFKRPRREGNLHELDSVKPDLEKYLNSLLRQTELENSQLLHSFLVDENFLGRAMSDSQIENAIRSVPRKLVVERGQHLATFLQRFLSSTKPKPCCPRSQSQSTGAISTTGAGTASAGSVLKATGSQASATRLGASAAGGDVSASKSAAGAASEELHNTVFQYVTYVANEVFQISKAGHTILMAARELADGVVDRLLSWFISRKIQQVSQEHRIEALILLLEEAVFSQDEESLACKEAARLSRRQQALTELKNFLPDVVWYLVDKDFVCTKLEEIFLTIQEPALNRQLAFVLFDIVIQELFEELRQG